MAKIDTSSIKKIYQLEINTNVCNYELYVNGIPADIQIIDTPIFYDLTINPWLKNGPNLISVKMIPVTDNAQLSNFAYFKGKLFEGVLSDQYVVEKEEFQAFASPDFQEMRRNDENIEINNYLINETIIVDIEYENALYTDLLKVKPSFNDLVELYSKVKRMFDSEQTNDLLEMMNFKMINYSNTVYKEPEVEYLRQRDIIEQLVIKETVPIDFSYYEFRADFGGKIFSMIDDEGTQPLAFIVNEEYFTFYPIYFGQRTKGEWEIIL